MYITLWILLLFRVTILLYISTLMSAFCLEFYKLLPFILLVERQEIFDCRRIIEMVFKYYKIYILGIWKINALKAKL